MKLLISVLLCCYMMHSTSLFAMNCRIIEYPDHNEAICGDDISDTQTVKSKTPSDREAVKQTELTIAIQNLKDRISRLQNEGYRYNENTSTSDYVSNTTVSGIATEATHLDATRNDYVTVTVSCDVTSGYSADVSVTIVGKNFEGKIISEVPLSGYVAGGHYTRLSASKKMKLKVFQNVLRWEAIEPKTSNKKYKNGSSDTDNKNQINNLIAEVESLQRQLKNNSTVSDNTSGSYNSSSSVTSYNYKSSSAGDIISLKKGVSFTHGSHQQRYDCGRCHANGSGPITGFGKDWSHKTCKGCHAEVNRGPTGCKGCHQ